MHYGNQRTSDVVSIKIKQVNFHTLIAKFLPVFQFYKDERDVNFSEKSYSSFLISDVSLYVPVV